MPRVNDHKSQPKISSDLKPVWQINLRPLSGSSSTSMGACSICMRVAGKLGIDPGNAGRRNGGSATNSLGRHGLGSCAHTMATEPIAAGLYLYQHKVILLTSVPETCFYQYVFRHCDKAYFALDVPLGSFVHLFT